MQESVLEYITKQAETLTPGEYLELIERLAHQLRKKNLSMTPEFDWQGLYGLGKGLWADEDAQEYVNRLREDRL